MQDKNAPFSHQYQPVNTSPYTQGYPEPPPPYTAQAPGTAPGPAPAPQLPAPYPQQAAVPLMAAPPVQPPMQQIVQPPVQQIVVPPPQQVVVPPAQAAQVIVVGGTVNLPPGTCTVCRKGKMKNSASFWTWLCCCLLLPVGILPGLCVFCCCCREPKCTNCGFTP